jgi:type IV pilus assembly protein PilC
MKFKYQARNQNGELQVGSVEASSPEAVTSILAGHNLFVLSIESQEKEGFTYGFLQAINRVKAKDLMVFTRQLATLVESQIPLSNALQSLYEQTKNVLLKEAIFQIREDIESGLSLSQALERQNSIFSDFYVSMIRSAEVTGKLEDAMLFLAGYIEKEAEWRSKISSALIYPAILLGLFFIVGMLMAIIVFPKILPVFQDMNVQLPLVSKIVLYGGSYIAQWWWVALIVVAGVAFMVFDYLKSAEGKAVRDQVILRLPVFGDLFQKVYIARFSRSFSVLIKGGLPITQAIEIAANTIGNVVYKEALDAITQGVREGGSFSGLLLNYPAFFPPMVSQMAAIGETTGKLEYMMVKISAFYDSEVSVLMSNLSSLIEPMLVLFIGILVGLLFSAILLPIYNLASSLQV